MIITAGILFTIYILYIRIKLGYFPKSLSITVQRFPLLLPGLLGTIATILLVYSYVTITDKLPLLAIGALGIFTVGVFSIVLKRVTVVHYIAAIVGFGFSIASIWLDYGNIFGFALIIVAGIISFIITPQKNRILWLELVMTYGLLINLLI